MEINENSFVDISMLISKDYPIYAHRPEESRWHGKDYDIQENNEMTSKYMFKEKETLQEHTKRCEKYFMKLYKQKGIEKVINKYERLYLGNLNEYELQLFRELFINTISFHDIGKINPLFQIKKMENDLKLSNEELGKLGTTHSSISSILYIDYYLDKVQALSLEARKEVRLILFLNAYVISRHHSSLDKFQDFFEGLVCGNDSKIEAMYVINIIKNNYSMLYKGNISLTENKIHKAVSNTNKTIKKLVKVNKEDSESHNDTKMENAVYLYTYVRLLYSVLVACDYYATTEYMTGVETKDFGNIKDIRHIYDIFENSKVNRTVRKYENDTYYNERKDLINEKNINILRSELFLDTEKELMSNQTEDVFFLEAPTGSGKSNVAMNLSLLLAKENSCNKIFYVYPFNTLVEQNRNTLENIFGEDGDILHQIAVINSISPIKQDEIERVGTDKEDQYGYYEKLLLNRQFLNYPIILTTHVSIFDIMFGNKKESVFGFHQLVNSIIVLDEIQSYKNTIWTEIITFLKAFANMLNIKVIIMSATLPNLNQLTEDYHKTYHLIKDREKYFSNSLFKKRVIVNYNLLENKIQLEDLYQHVMKHCEKKKVLIEFIRKESAYQFYRMLLENKNVITCSVELMTGDDNIFERDRILRKIKDTEEEKEGIILVATQVVEAGVDIDMDIGYKNISKLDSEEQFMGRINRSCKKEGIVYFFYIDEVQKIYKNDYRVNHEFSLLDHQMRDILITKDFEKYYVPILSYIKKNNAELNDDNINEFYINKVGKLDFEAVKERMELIEEDNWSMNIYLSKKIITNDGKMIDGKELWYSYKKLLQNQVMSFAKKKVLLLGITSQMNNFIYEVKKNDSFVYDDKIGELYYIEEGEQYFKDGKLDKEKFENQIGVFI